MTDELDDLKAAMRAATPAPDPANKAADLALAEKNFAARQGSAGAARQTSDRPKSGLFRGAISMFHALTSRGGLVASTALIAVGFVAFVPVSDLLPPSPAPLVQIPTTQQAPTPEAMADAVPEPLIEPAAKQDEAVRTRIAPPAPAGAVARTVAGQTPPRIAPVDPLPQAQDDTETYANEAQSPVKVAADDPVSTFSIDVDTASYAVVRDFLMNGTLPPSEAVRIEEMINYFPYAYPAPAGDAPFRPTVSVTPTPWNADTQLLHIALQGSLPAISDRPPLNLVFLIDTSGSMQNADKLPLLKQSFALMLDQLRPDDQVAIVTYAGSAGQVLEPTAASDKRQILAALNRLEAGGSTAGQEGLQQAYEVARGMSAEGEVSRILLATDGDFNVGLSDPEALEDYIAKQRDSGTYLSVLGFGRGNLDDATMQALAQNGNGTAAYIDTLTEAQKVLVDQLTGALFPIADDVKVQVEFNPAQIAEYRLIGYETRALRREDFNNDRVDAGEIGAGHSVTALYEITPVGSPARLTDPLRYGAAGSGAGQDAALDAGPVAEELGFLRLRYKAPGADSSQLIETPITADLPAYSETGFAAAIAGFGQLLRDDTYLGDWSWGDAIALANAHRGADPYGYRSEAVRLMRLAESLSAQ